MDFMKCQKCGKEFPEKEIQTSHDVPCYLFEGRNRQEKKQHADKFGRHNLCIKCHDIYEKIAFSEAVNILEQHVKDKMIFHVKYFSRGYFNDKTVYGE